MACVTFLLSEGACLLQKDSEGLTAAAHALAFDHIDIVKILPVYAFDTDHLNLDIKMTKNKNKNIELQKSENSINVQKSDAMTNNKNDNKNENKDENEDENENKNENEDENENENENKYDNDHDHDHGNSRSAFHIVCQWGSVKSLKFLLELNTIMTINDDKEDETKNDNTNDGRNHIIINKLNRNQNENVNENRVGTGDTIKYDDNHSNDNNDDSNNNKTRSWNTNNNDDSNDNRTLNTNSNDDSNNNKKISWNTNKFTNKKNNLNIKMTDGTQPIHLAARYGHLNCLRILIINNAEINTMDCYGNTPFMLAKKWGRKECELYLSEMLLKHEII